MNRILSLSWLALLAVLIAPQALAYLDPASGSMFLQMVAGGIAGLALIVKLYWHKVLGIFGVKKSQEIAEDIQQEHEETPA